MRLYTRLAMIAGLALLATGCNGPKREVVRTLPDPAVPRPPAPRVDRPASPSPPPLIQARPNLGGLKPLTGKKVVVDAGHGGKDPGTKGVSPLPEKTIVLSIANQVAGLLRDRRATVISTRTTDRFLELDDRAAIAERNKANVFISIHADSAQRASASGTTLYVARNASSQSYAVARSIQSAFASAGIPCRGIHTANFRVLVGHSRPAVLVECGFLTNAADARNLNNSSYRQRIAAAIARGVADYLSR
jgi:N-acetylmuramoyl-L-alanine amidase